MPTAFTGGDGGSGGDKLPSFCGFVDCSLHLLRAGCVALCRIGFVP